MSNRTDLNYLTDPKSWQGGNIPQAPIDTTFTYLLTRIREARKNPNWPGLPIGQIDLVYTAELNAAIAAGVVEKVERPAKTNPNRTATFICEVEED